MAPAVRSHGLSDDEGTLIILHHTARLGQCGREHAMVYRRIEFAVDCTQDLKLFGLVEPCSGAPIRIEDAVPVDIGLASSRSPADGPMVDVSDCEETVQGTI